MLDSVGLTQMEYLGNSVQPRGKIVTNKIASLHAVSVVQKCARISKNMFAVGNLVKC